MNSMQRNYLDGFKELKKQLKKLGYYITYDYDWLKNKNILKPLHNVSYYQLWKPYERETAVFEKIRVKLFPQWR